MITATLNTVISNAKCCLGEFTCKISGKAQYGQGYKKTMLMTGELSLYIFALENYLIWPDEDCITMANIEEIASRINKICGCDCAAETAFGESVTGSCTTESHTTLSHTV